MSEILQQMYLNKSPLPEKVYWCNQVVNLRVNTQGKPEVQGHKIDGEIISLWIEIDNGLIEGFSDPGFQTVQEHEVSPWSAW